MKGVRHAVADVPGGTAVRVHGNEHVTPRHARGTPVACPRNLAAVGYSAQFAREELHPPSRRAPHPVPNNRRHPVAQDLSTLAIERTPHSL